METKNFTTEIVEKLRFIAPILEELSILAVKSKKMAKSQFSWEIACNQAIQSAVAQLKKVEFILTSESIVLSLLNESMAKDERLRHDKKFGEVQK